MHPGLPRAVGAPQGCGGAAVIQADAELAHAAVDAGLFWHMDRWANGHDVLTVRGVGVSQLSRLMSKTTVPVYVEAVGRYGVRWIAMARN